MLPLPLISRAPSPSSVRHLGSCPEIQAAPTRLGRGARDSSRGRPRNTTVERARISGFSFLCRAVHAASDARREPVRGGARGLRAGILRFARDERVVARLTGDRKCETCETTDGVEQEDGDDVASRACREPSDGPEDGGRVS